MQPSSALVNTQQTHVQAVICQRSSSHDSWVVQDAPGNWGGNLIFSTTAAGNTGQLTDRLTIDTTGLATFTSSILLSSTASTLTAYGNTVLGTTLAQSLTVNAASTFASTAVFTASTALSASGNVLLNGGSSQTLTVQASSTFSAPVIVNAAVNITGLGTFSGGVALTTPVTVNGVSIAKVALTDNYTDLVGQPRFYAGSSNATIMSGAATLPQNISTWYGSATVSSGSASVHPTLNGTATGTALFSNILSVSATVYAPSSTSAITVPFAAVTSISLQTVTMSVVTGTTVVTVVAGGAPSVVYATSGTVMCTIVGIYSS